MKQIGANDKIVYVNRDGLRFRGVSAGGEQWCERVWVDGAPVTDRVGAGGQIICTEAQAQKTQRRLNRAVVRRVTKVLRQIINETYK